MTRRLVLRMPHGARKKAQKDGPVGWTVEAPSRTRRASQKRRKMIPEVGRILPGRSRRIPQ